MAPDAARPPEPRDVTPGPRGTASPSPAADPPVSADVAMPPAARRPTGLQHLALNALFLEPRMGGMVTYAERLVGALVEAAPTLRLSVLVGERGRPAFAGAPWSDEVELV